MEIKIERASLRCACAVYQYAFKEANSKIMSELVDTCIIQLEADNNNISFTKLEAANGYVYILKFDPTQRPALKEMHIKRVTADIDAVTVVLA